MLWATDRHGGHCYGASRYCDAPGPCGLDPPSGHPSWLSSPASVCCRSASAPWRGSGRSRPLQPRRSAPLRIQRAFRVGAARGAHGRTRGTSRRSVRAPSASRRSSSAPRIDTAGCRRAASTARDSSPTSTGSSASSLPHNAAAQYASVVPVGRSALRPGDLVFFHGLGHVGLYVGRARSSTRHRRASGSRSRACRAERQRRGRPPAHPLVTAAAARPCAATRSVRPMSRDVPHAPRPRRRHADRAARPLRRRRAADAAREARVPQPGRLEQGSHRARDDRGGRARGQAPPGRHDRRADLGQHRRRARDRGRAEGLPLHLRDAGQDEPGEDLDAARLRRRGRDHADRGRPRLARVATTRSPIASPRRSPAASSPTSTRTWRTPRRTTRRPRPRSGSRPTAARSTRS